MTTYKSKVGLTILIPIIILIGGTAVLMAINSLWFLFVFIISLLFFVIYFFCTISYSITDQKILSVKCSFLFVKKIDIDSITNITETNNPISSPAASLDRLEIKFKRGSVIISPQKKDLFINHLIELNPSIQVKLKRNYIVG